MLKDSLYLIKDIMHDENRISALIKLDAKHPIFRGHYPGRPVLPGACTLQIIKEILQKALSCKLILTKADQIKFVQMIDPHDNNYLQVAITYHETDGKLKVNASLNNNQSACFKMRGYFKKA